MSALNYNLIDQRRQNIFQSLYPYTEELLATGILLAGIELNVLQNLSETQGTHINQIASQSGVSSYRIKLLLNGLSRIGILSLNEDGYYYLTKGHGAIFDPSHAAYCGDICMGFKQSFIEIFNMKEILRNESGLPKPPARDQKQTDYYQSMVLSFNQQWAQEMLTVIHDYCGQAQRFLDLGGGHGHYSLLLLNRLEQAEGFLIDLPGALNFCRRLHEHDPAFPRLHLKPGDAMHFQLDEKMDFIMLNDLLHYFSIAHKKTILKQCVDHLTPGGTIAISKFHLQDDEQSMTENFMFSIKNFLQSKDGYLASDATIKTLLTELGLEELLCYRSQDGIKSLLIFQLK